MTKRSKAYRAAAEKIQSGVLYTPAEAIHLAKSTSITKFDATVDVVFRLGVDPRKADQMVRGTVSLPHGTGKTARVVVFAQGERAEQALAAGADEVGGDELIEKVAKGYTDFDAAVATPDLMGKVGRLGRVLGPRGLMPNPRTGTVTMDVAKAVSDIKGGRIEFRVDRASNLHFIIGKASFTEEQLTENFQAALEEVLRLKPSTSKGRYILKEQVHLELAARAVTLASGLKTAFEAQHLDLVALVDGNPRKGAALVEKLETMLDEALNEYSREMEFEVTFEAEQSGVSEPEEAE